MTQPHADANAEKALLGAILQFPNILPDVAAKISSGDFYTPRHATIFDSAVALWNEGNPVDATTVLAELDRRQQLVRVGGAPYLTELLQSQLTGDSAPYYANLISQKAKLRKIAELGMRLQQATELDAEEALSAVHRFVDELDVELSTDSDDFDSAYKSWVNWYEDDTVAIPTPWNGVNQVLLGGLHRGRLYVIAGRPGAGKSTFALQAALQAANAGYQSLLFSLEMSREECMSRLLAASTGTPLKNLLTHRLSREDREKVERFASSHSRPKLRINDTPTQTIESIMAECRAAKQRGGLDVVVIDHTLLLDPTDRRARTDQQVSHIAKMAKLMSRRLGVAVILCHQLNRAIERENRRPQMSDLKEGSEADSDVIMILTRSDEGITSWVVKNRMGKTDVPVTLVDELRYARLG